MLASKFILLLSLAKYLSPSEVGLFGLISVTVSYSIHFVGLDFYIYTTRELIRRGRQPFGNKVKAQFLGSLFLYVVFFFIFYLAVFEELLSRAIFIIVCLLIVSEHLSQELHRLLIAQSSQVKASSLLFIRNGAWCLFAVAALIISDGARSVEFVLKCWLSGSAMSIVVGIALVDKTIWSGWSKKVELSWLLAGVKVAIPFMFSTLAIRSIQTFDRYIVEYLVGIEILAVYVLAVGACNAIKSFVDAGVSSFFYPRLISLESQGCYQEFKASTKKFMIHLSMVAFVLSIAALASFYLYSLYLENSIYRINIEILVWLLGSNFIFLFSLVPHYALYSKGHDKYLVRVNYISCMIFFVVVALAQLFDPYRAVLIASFISFSTLLALKLYKMNHVLMANR